MTATETRTNPTAVAAAIVAGLGICFWGIGGIAAIALGLAARSQIARSEGRESGTGLAILGIALGSLNLGACILAVAIGIALGVRPATPTVRPLPVPGPLPAPSVARPATSGEAAQTATRESGRSETLVGKVRVVDVGLDSTSLRRLLDAERGAAERQSERLLIFVAAPNCLPCNGVMLALADPRMQSALADVRILRLDAAVFGAELVALGIPVDTVPGFALLGPRLKPLDYVHGGEWDADVAENIAPVLSAFVRGKYAARRHRFQNERPDQTAL